jgi:hypothetical protein
MQSNAALESHEKASAGKDSFNLQSNYGKSIKKEKMDKFGSLLNENDLREMMPPLAIAHHNRVES